MSSDTLERKIIFSILFALCIASIQIAYAEPQFAFKFGSTGTGDDEFDNPTDVVVDKDGKNIYVVDNKNNRISVFDDDGDDDFQYGSFCDIGVIQNCNDNAEIVIYIIEGGKHSWYLNVGIHSPKVIIDFFKSHTLN